MSYTFCNEKEALRAGMRIFAQQLLSEPYCESSKIEEILNKVSKVKEVKELHILYSKLRSLESGITNIKEKQRLQAEYEKALEEYRTLQAKYDAEYQETFKKACDEIKNSVTKISRSIEVSNDIFRYIRNSRDLKTQWEELQRQIFQEQDYSKLVELYKNFEQFVIHAIHQYNEDYGDMVQIPNFIEPQEIVRQIATKPQLKEVQHTKVYTDTEKILEEIFVDDIVEYSNDSYSLPNIIDYDTSFTFRNQDLITTPDEIEGSRFFKNLFFAINKTISAILKVYEKAKTTTPGYLTAEAEAINERVSKVVTKKFNEIYGKSGDDAYRFDFKLDKEEISLSIFKGGDVAVLDDQSNGFKWFFNLYFNLLNGATLQSGDIVLMDEPAHNLSPKARKECANYLRKYGEERGVTFFIITHDVFWIDSDFLNEVRIVRNRQDKELKGVFIQNDFSRIESSDTDTFSEIKRAFGVDTHVFYPPSVRLIFVEGITDYNYLTTFKLLYEEEKGEKTQIVFLPICGLGREGEEQIILEKLMRQCKEPILLVDSDKAGKKLKEIKKQNNYEKMTIIELSEVAQNWKEIESLFDKKDNEKYGLSLKRGNVSNAFKKRILWKKSENMLEKTTKGNFYKLIEHLTKGI